MVYRVDEFEEIHTNVSSVLFLIVSFKSKLYERKGTKIRFAEGQDASLSTRKSCLCVRKSD